MFCELSTISRPHHRPVTFWPWRGPKWKNSLGEGGRGGGLPKVRMATWTGHLENETVLFREFLPEPSNTCYSQYLEIDWYGWKILIKIEFWPGRAGKHPMGTWFGIVLFVVRRLKLISRCAMETNMFWIFPFSLKPGQVGEKGLQGPSGLQGLQGPKGEAVGLYFVVI